MGGEMKRWLQAFIRFLSRGPYGAPLADDPIYDKLRGN
jgi:hypothetical protein